MREGFIRAAQTVKRFFFPTEHMVVRRYWRRRNQILNGTGFMDRLLRPVRQFLNTRLLTRFNAQVPCRREIAPFVTPHGFSGIFISSGAVIGQGCVVFQQATVGSNTLRDSAGAGAPVIGSNVLIGAGAKIIGAVTVGDNARIGANCVVTHDVPANATVVLPAPRIILHDTPRDNSYRGIDEFTGEG